MLLYRYSSKLLQGLAVGVGTTTLYSPVRHLIASSIVNLLVERSKYVLVASNDSSMPSALLVDMSRDGVTVGFFRSEINVSPLYLNSFHLIREWKSESMDLKSIRIGWFQNEVKKWRAKERFTSPKLCARVVLFSLFTTA